LSPYEQLRKRLAKQITTVLAVLETKDTRTYLLTLENQSQYEGDVEDETCVQK
jgi:hypothetical protein